MKSHGTFADGERVAKLLCKRGYKWMALRQFLQLHRETETKEFVSGFESFMDTISDYQEGVS